MADVGVRVQLTGADEAQRGLERLTKAANDAALEDKHWETIQRNLRDASEKLRGEQDRRAKSLEELKRHTMEVVARTQEQMREEERAASVIGRVTDALKSKALQYLSVGAAIGGFVAVLKGSLSASHAAEESTVRLEAVIRATGGSVGLTTARLHQLAETWQRATRFDSEGIKSAMAVMLTFGNVQGDVFERGMKLAMDYAELFKTDLAGAARIVGRALEDPVNGLTALQRVIGTVNPATKDYIEELVRAGRVAEAQAEILALLQGKFGGLAEKLRTADRGTATLREEWDELLKTLGQTTPFETAEKGLLGLGAMAVKGWRLIIQESGRAIDDAVQRAQERRLENLRSVVKDEKASADFRNFAQQEILRIEKITQTERTKVAVDEAAARAAAEAKAQDALIARLKDKTGLEKNRIAEIAQELKGLYAIVENQATKGGTAKAAEVQMAAYERIGALEKEQQRLVSEGNKKAAEAAKKARDLVLGTFDYKIKIGEAEVADKIAVIDRMLVAVRKGSAEELSLLNEKQKLTEQIKKTAEEQAKNWVLGAEAMTKADEELIYSWDAFGNRITVTKKDYVDALGEMARARDRQAQAELRQINETTFLFKEQKIEALEALRQKYEDLGEDGKKALERIKGELEAVRGSTRTTGVVVQQAGIDMGEVWKRVHSGITTAFTEIGKWALGIGSSVKSVGDAIKTFFASISSSIIEMFAKIAADKVFVWLTSALSGTALGEFLGLGGTSGAVGGAVSGASQGLFSNLVGGGGGGFSGALSNVGSGIARLFGFGGPEASMEGFAAATAALGTPALGTPGVLGGLSSGGFSGLGGLSSFAGPAAMIAGGLALVDLLSGDDNDNEVYRWHQGDRSWWYSQGIYTEADMNAYVTKTGRFTPAPGMADTGAGAGVWNLFASGTDSIVTKPTPFIAGEAGPERVTVSPLAGAARHGMGDGGISISVSGLSLMDNYAARKLVYELRRQLRA